MKLGEIAGDSTITVAVTRGDVGVELSTIPAFVFPDRILAEPFKHNDSIVRFDGAGLEIEMIVCRENEVPNVWKGVSITREIYEGNLYHCIRSGVDGVRLNRRGSFRVFVGEQSSVNKIPKGSTESITVKDISSSGIGLFVKSGETNPYELGDQLHINYEDKEAYYTIDVIARVMRIEQREPGTVIGCRFVKMYPQVERYVAAKQLKNRNKKMPLKK